VIGWVLGTFHTAVVGLALVLLSYPGGGLGTLLASLDTPTGIALFVALWTITVFATGRALRGLDPLAPVAAGPLFRRALRWGALNGVLFLWAAATLLALSQLIRQPGTLDPRTLALGAGFVLGPVSLFALGIGAAVGLALTALDLAALALARRLAPDEGG
jgi:hypothetical protein